MSRGFSFFAQITTSNNLCLEKSPLRRLQIFDHRIGNQGNDIIDHMRHQVIIRGILNGLITLQILDKKLLIVYNVCKILKIF